MFLSVTSGSQKTGGLVDYADDEDDDYVPVPRRKPQGTDEEEEEMESLVSKRKLASKEKEPELAKKQKLAKNSKSKDSVFASLCSTLSQAVLPGKKTSNPVCASDSTSTNNIASEEHEGKEESAAAIRNESDNSSASNEESDRDKESAASRKLPDCFHSSTENRQLGGEDRPLIAPNSSPEMTVNGS